MHSPTTPHRRRRRLRRALVAAALVVCVLPASASAARLGFDDGTLVYSGGGDRNQLSIREVPNALIVSDPAGLSHLFTDVFGFPSNACVRLDRQTRRCQLVSNQGRTLISRVVARMDDGDDIAGPINTQLPVLIEGGVGRDTYEAGSPSFLTQVTFRGGSGLDTASYAGSGGTGGGRGVRVDNDGLADDGRSGLDADNIGRDVEELTGSRFADELIAAGDDIGPNCCNRVRGGLGDDVLRVGLADMLVVFEMGPVADGADKVIGGPANSIIIYRERTRPVNATLNFGGADDGEVGERDEILGGHEGLEGGQAGDTLQAPALSRAAHDIRGHGGNDLIDGADGPDELFGGAGGDSIRGLGGADQLFAKDGERDTVGCGLGTDLFEVDSIDNFGDCENATVGVLGLAPRALRATAGETARLKLSWRHPRSWRQLRRVTLRLYRGEARVGAVAITPPNRRVRDRGAVTVLRRSSRITRKGKTVSARLALRLDRSLAGRRLRVEVEAVDGRGTRQLERNAGSIHVSR